MTTNRQTPDEIFDAAVAAVRDQPLDAQTVAAAQARVARRLEAELALPAEGEVDHRIRGCSGFQALIPAYLAGALAEPKRILFEDHTRECVPCRRALNEAKKGTKRSEEAARVSTARFAVPRWALAAGLALATLAGGAFLAGRYGLVGPDATAKVKAIDGELLLVQGGATSALSAGATVERGQLVRTASGSSAVLELADGSEVELAPRTELALARRSDGVVVDVDRGEVIVEAAERRRGHLYVATDDMTVSVVGTIFAVDHGVRGSRVAVLDGEVHVRRQGAALAVLRPGDQLATAAQLRRASLDDEFGWSRNSAEYKERIAALAALGRELDAALAVEGDRTSTRLLDLAPAATTIWLGLPNLSGQLADAWTLVEQRVAESPVLADWWAEKMGGADGAEIADAVARLRQLGSGLGAEIGVAVVLDAQGEPETPIVMAEVVDRGFAAALDAEIAKLDAQAAAAGHETGHLRRVASPAEATGDETLFVWLAADDLVVASPAADGLRAVESALAAGNGGLVGTPFHARLTEAYADGAGWLLGVDAARILASHQPDAEHADAFTRLGLADAQQFIVESETASGLTQTRATLGFAGPRQGVASWLAAPASSEALEFVSANAQFAASALVKRPAAMFDDVWAAISAEEGADAVAKREELEAKLGFSLRDDFAAAFGGDVAVAIDGPWLPKPSWKLVVELTDAGRLDFVAQKIVDTINAEAAAHGKPGVRLSQEESDGRVYFRLTTEAGVDLAYASVIDGYLVAAPSKALIVEAIAHRAAGTTLVASQAFRSRLPQDADADFSAMVWQDLTSSLGQLGQLFSAEGVAPELREQMEQMAAESGPTLVVAYGERDRLGFAAQGTNGPLGFSFERILSILGAVAGGAPDADEPDETGDETPTRTTA